MGVINVTPDSFSDGGKHLSLNAALERAAAMVEEGAAVFDVGGESTRPGAVDVSLEQELQRVVPLIEALSKHFDLPISIDTQKPGVMRAAVGAGAGLINDVNGLREAGALPTAAELNVPVCLMHMQGTPRIMQADPSYVDVVGEVTYYLEGRIAACLEAGVLGSNIIVDPGFGFGKTLQHNLELLNGLARLAELGYPVLAGMSRKRMIGEITGQNIDKRLAGSLAAAVLAVQNGAVLIRTHDVAETVDALKIIKAAALAVDTQVERNAQN
jgi:dihydropteroate synthase